MLEDMINDAVFILGTLDDHLEPSSSNFGCQVNKWTEPFLSDFLEEWKEQVFVIKSIREIIFD